MPFPPRRLAHRLAASCLVAAGLTGVLAWPATMGADAAAAASGPCGPGRTALGGSLAGSPDGAPLNASVNVELTDARTRRAYDVFADGRVDTVGRPAGTRYSVVDHVNPERTSETAAAHVDRTWGRPGGSGVLCFTSNPRITQAYVEIYPRRPVDTDGDGRTDRHVTDRRDHGAAAHYRQPVRSGASNTGIALRLPRHTRAHVGFVDAFVSYRGRAVPVAAPGCGQAGRPGCVGITAVRAFPLATFGPACGIEGFSASADVLDPRVRQGTLTRVRIRALAGGRCGAATQSYSIRVTCVSWCGRNAGGGTSRTTGPERPPAVRSGSGVAVPVVF